MSPTLKGFRTSFTARRGSPTYCAAWTGVPYFDPGRSQFLDDPVAGLWEARAIARSRFGGAGPSTAGKHASV